MIVGIDHAIIAVDDLEQALKAYRRLGFQVLRGGEHPRYGTHNALVPLSDGSYLELMGVKDRGLAERFPPTRLVAETLAGENRLALFVLESDDLGADVEAIRKRGLSISEPKTGERRKPDGERVAWRTAHPEDSRLPFLIRDDTQREIRVPPPTEGIGRRLRIAHVAIRAIDAERVMSQFAKLLGRRPAGGQFTTNRGRVLINDGDAEFEPHSVAMFAEDLQNIAEEWEDRGIPFPETEIEDHADGIAPKETVGVRLLFLDAAAR